MNSIKDRTKLDVVLLLSLCAATQTWGQVTIGSDDMFNRIGQDDKLYANRSDVVVSGRLGTTGGPQAWDFTSGPTDDVYRFDYVAVNDEGNGTDFPNAKIAERKTEQANGSKAWLYFEQVPGVGRKVYGAHEKKINADAPVLIFQPPVIDFPETISYGDKWAATMSYKTEFLTFDTQPDPDDPDSDGGSLTIPLIVETSSEFVVDAHGILNLPGISFGNALRVNELAMHTFKVDIEGNGSFETFATEFVRTYYWLREDNGIAAQITSKHQNTPPPDNFTTASHFIRMFESNHPKGTVTVAPAIRNLKLTINDGRALLNWTKNASAKSYRVEYTSKPGGTEPWTKLEETPNNFVLDATISSAPARFYRVVPIN